MKTVYICTQQANVRQYVTSVPQSVFRVLEVLTQAGKVYIHVGVCYTASFSDGWSDVISHSLFPLISSAGRHGSHTKADPSLPVQGEWQAN